MGLYIPFGFEVFLSKGMNCDLVGFGIKGYIQNAGGRVLFGIALFTTHTGAPKRARIDSGAPWERYRVDCNPLTGRTRPRKRKRTFWPSSLNNIAFGTHAYSASVFTIFGRPRFTSTPLARFNSSAAKRC